MHGSAANRATAVNLPELVRSQATVARSSYMRAMIPHHSIAIMTCERAQIREPRVQKLAHDIIEAQRREIAEMRYLIAAFASGHTVESIYRDPPAEPGTVEDASSQVLLSQLDLAPMPEAEALRVLDADTRCTFNRSPESNPILSADRGGGAVVKLNGVLVNLTAPGEPVADGGTFLAPGIRVAVRHLGEGADWRADAQLTFELDPGLSLGYRGFYGCTQG